MFKKNALRIITVMCLVLLVIACVAGCDKGGKISKYNLPQQYRNVIYYFEQGFPEGWSLTGNPDGKYSDESKALVITITKDDDASSARYCVYKQKEHADIPLTSSLKDMYALTVNPDHALYFNTRNGTRENFAITNSEAIDFILNGRQYYSSTYTFTEGGDNWQGQYFLLPDSRQYYLISYEAKVDSWAAFEPTFKEMMNDFRPTGFESDNTIS